MTAAKRARADWHPALTPLEEDSFNVTRVYARATREGVYWIDGVVLRLRADQVISCPRDAYVNYVEKCDGRLT